MKKIISIILIAFLFFSCSKNKLEEKGFSVNTENDDDDEQISGIQKDSLQFETRPKSVLLTFNPTHRLTPIFMVNYHKKTKKPFTGSVAHHWNYSDYGRNDSCKWNYNFMPGFEAVYGYNFVNISHYNNETKLINNFFEKPVLIKTLYYPAYSNDTLNYKPIFRKHYMVSTYDEDTNKDGFINVRDLRRFYYFDINAENKRILIPKNYSVMSSEYDPANDYMYIYAKLDQNNNGKIDGKEETHIFWIDLKNPEKTGRAY